MICLQESADSTASSVTPRIQIVQGRSAPDLQWLAFPPNEIAESRARDFWLEFACQYDATNMPSGSAIHLTRLGRAQIMTVLTQVRLQSFPLGRVWTPKAYEENMRLEQEVVGAYAPIEQVAMIYADHANSQEVFTLFISGERYDDALMDRLLDCEWSLRRRYGSRGLSFRYLPDVPQGTHRDALSIRARLIFMS